MAQSATNTNGNLKVSFDFAKTPITQIADYIIIAAAKQKASDIHFDPREEGMMVRFRIDGDLADYSFIPKAYERNLTTRLKLMANMNITESRLPQDGAIKGTFGDQYLDMRVSCLPLNEGEKVVIRILDYTRSLQGIDTLGFHKDNLVKLKRMMETPNGIILVTGATGSGKSTTTYSMLQELNKTETNIITVEDPIEMNIQGINQVQVNSEIGMTFAAALRSILRQDPNIILIGEIRDSETAQIAVRAAITGHLVLSTIHTNNSLSTIERLMDMDVERYLLSTALTGIISQRLAKCICPHCRIQRPTTPYEQKIFRTYMNLDVQNLWDANPNGCEYCHGGYKGRIAVQEVLEIDDEIRTALTIEGVTKDKLRKMVYTDKTITLLQDALIKCLNGDTNFEEVYRVIEMENDSDEDYKSELTAAIREGRAANSLDPIQATPIVQPSTINVSNLTVSQAPIQVQTATAQSPEENNSEIVEVPTFIDNQEVPSITPIDTNQTTAPVIQPQIAPIQVAVPQVIPQVISTPIEMPTITDSAQVFPTDENGNIQLPNVVSNLKQVINKALTDAISEAVEQVSSELMKDDKKEENDEEDTTEKQDDTEVLTDPDKQTDMPEFMEIPDTDSVVVPTEKEESEVVEQKPEVQIRPEIGSDAVDENLPILEELPRLSTEYEPPLEIENNEEINSLDIPEFVQ